MKMRCSLSLLVSCIALSASADKAHEMLEAHKEAILAKPITVCGEVAFSVGRSTSPRNRGDAVGYAKAEDDAKWNLGEKYRTTAPWPSDIKDEEKQSAWMEYRVLHPERFSVLGMQRIMTRKERQDRYLVVLSFPADQINVPAPTKEELLSALNKVRQRHREVEARRQANAARTNAVVEASAGRNLQKPACAEKKIETPVKSNESFDESMLF